MKGLRRVANWIDFFVSLVAAVWIYVVITAVGGQWAFWRGIFTGGAKPAIYAGLFLALLLLLGAILRAVQRVTGHAASRYLVFDTPNGSVSVRAGSVEQVIDRTVRAMDEVADADATLDLAKGAAVPAAVKIRCRLYNRPNLLAVQDQVRAVVRQCYVEMFPSEEPLPIQISIERIVFESKAPQPAPTPPSELGEDDEGDAEPMRPQYPVDDK